MENFSTVLWIVVIAAAMIFNVVSQSRKQAKKQARAGRRQARRQRGMAVMGSGCGAATGFKGGHSRPQEVQPAVAPGATPTNGAVCRIRRCGPGGRFRAHCIPSAGAATCKKAA